MDKDVGARLDEGDFVKMSVKADGATAVHAWITNKNSYHYSFDNPDCRLGLPVTFTFSVSSYEVPASSYPHPQ